MALRRYSRLDRERADGRVGSAVAAMEGEDDLDELDEDEVLPLIAPGADDSEPVRFRKEIARRSEEVVLITRTAAEAAALRGWGLLAVAHPQNGRWCEAGREVFEGRDAVFVDAELHAPYRWADRDIQAIGLVVRRIGFHTPQGCERAEPGRDLAAFVQEQRARGIGPEGVAQETRGSLVDLRELAARDAKAGRALEPGGPEWPPLRYGRPPAAVPFPVDVLAEPVARFVRAVAEAVGAPADFAGLAVLVTAGAALGRSVALELKPGYRVAPGLFGLNVGGASSGTSPSQAAVLQPLRAIGAELQRLYAVESVDYENAVQEAKREKEAKPRAPVLQSALLEDMAFETVAAHLARSPRGLLVACDEAAPWVARLARGAERRLWFSALRGLPVRVDPKRVRTVDAPIRLDEPFLAFCGNIAPGVLKSVGERAEGLWDRVLFAFPEPVPCAHWSGRGLPDEVRVGWADAIDRLRGSTSADAEPIATRTVRLALDAQEEWAGWYDAQADALNEPDADVVERAVDTKLCDFTARLALILHALDAACHPTRAPGAPLMPVSRSALLRALRLGAYFRVQHQRARWTAGHSRVDGTARAIVEWLRRTGRTRFSVSKLKDSLRWLAQRPGEPDAALDWLERRGAVARQAAKRPGRRGGRPASAVYAVHPELHTREPRETRETAPHG